MQRSKILVDTYRLERWGWSTRRLGLGYLDRVRTLELLPHSLAPLGVCHLRYTSEPDDESVKEERGSLRGWRKNVTGWCHSAGSEEEWVAYKGQSETRGLAGDRRVTGYQAGMWNCRPTELLSSALVTVNSDSFFRLPHRGSTGQHLIGLVTPQTLSPNVLCSKMDDPIWTIRSQTCHVFLDHLCRPDNLSPYERGGFDLWTQHLFQWRVRATLVTCHSK